MPLIGGIPGLREGGISKTPGKKKFHTIASSTPSKTPGRSRDPNRHAAAATPSRGVLLFQHAVDPAAKDDSVSSDSNIKVYIRVRPLSGSEKAGSGETVVSVPTADTVILNSTEPKPFTFDHVADPEATQQHMFDLIGTPLADSFLAGYNGCIFAYGQTGSGKTYTMQGPDFDITSNDERAGLIPRTLDYMFRRIQDKENAASVLQEGSLKHTCRCAYLEIYNEQISDLLDTSKVNLNVRENSRDGIYVDGITWEEVTSASETLAVLIKGVRNRHVGETAMNKESSRSHSVFTIKVESTSHSAEGLTKKRHSVLNLVDLAGSERQKSTAATGDRLKEATNINKSLSALGNVIMALADMTDGKPRHVHYRDSKLTFLLKDSLGGNSKTAIIANISPSDRSFGETLSTLKFAQRAKLIKTRAILNEDTNGNLDQLRGEIKRLKDELASARNAPSSISPSNNGNSNADKSRASSTSPNTSTSSSSPGGAAVREMQGRIGELENLLFQCLEQQAVAECEVAAAMETSQRAQAMISAVEGKENELFLSLRMQIKLKNETIKTLAKGTNKGRSSCESDQSRRSDASEQGDDGEDAMSDQDKLISLLRQENDELRKAQELSWVNNPEVCKITKENLKLQEMLSEIKGSDVEARKVVDSINRELRDQYMHTCRDKKRLEAELATARAAAAAAASAASSPYSSESPSRRLASMTSPERASFESARLELQQQKFDEEVKRLEAEVRDANRNAMCYKTQLESFQRQSEMEGDVVAPVHRDTPEDQSDKQASLQEEVSRMEGQISAFAASEKQLKSQLEAAEFALSVLEARNSVGRKSLCEADAGAKLQLAQEEVEKLQVKMQELSDEYDNKREEFEFRETTVAKLEQQVADLLAKTKEQASVIEEASCGDSRDHAELVREVGELKESLDKSQTTYEATKRELDIVAEVLRTTQSQLETKEAALDRAKNEAVESNSEMRELKTALDAALAECDKVSGMLSETKRRHEALIDDREGTEQTHQQEQDEMMNELKRRQGIIAKLESELASAKDSADQSSKRLSVVEMQAGEAADLRAQLDELKKNAECKDSEMFEVNFELQSAQRNLKLATGENEEMEARLEETYQACLEQKRMMEDMKKELDKFEEENGGLKQAMSTNEETLATATKECDRLTSECESLHSKVQQLTNVAEASAKRVLEVEKAKDEAVAKGAKGKVLELELEAKGRELCELQSKMEDWIAEMKALKEQQTSAKEEASRHLGALDEAKADLESARKEVDVQAKKIVELDEEIKNLSGHNNTKQKVQYTVKIKEENNELKADLNKSQHSLSVLKQKSEKLEKEVNKMRSAIGIESSAAQVLADEAKALSQIEAKEKEFTAKCDEMRKHHEAVEAAVVKIVTATGASADHGDALKMLDSLKDYVHNRDFEIGMLKKELHIFKGASSASSLTQDSENRHPNSPSVSKTARHIGSRSPGLGGAFRSIA